MNERANNFERTLLAFFLTIVLCFPLFVSAQTDTSGQRPMTEREKQILEHERRIQAILDQRKKEREAQQQRLLEEKRQEESMQKARQQAAAAPRAPATLSRTAVPRAPAPGKPVQFARTGLSTVILYIDPLDATVKEGDQFASDVRLYAEGTFSCDSLAISLSYDRNCIEPVRVYDYALRPLVIGDPDFSVDQSVGTIHYAAKFKKPEALGKEPLLTILWRARSAAEFTTVHFLFGTDGTRLDLNGTDQLGTALSPEDGTISASVTILPKAPLRGKVLPPTTDLALTFSGDWDNMLGKVNLRLQGPARQVKIHEVFFVDVMLTNPYQIPCDNVSLWVRFDPDKLEVLDYDRRNWISLGTNILDGFAHESFPFNYHKRNEADNLHGEIFYDMGLSSPLPLPSGAFARIKFRAKAPADSTDIWLARSRNNSFPTSDVAYLGQSLLPSGEKKQYASAIAVHISEQR
jgi:hypothetical protein